MHCLFIFQDPASGFFTALDSNEVDASAKFFEVGTRSAAKIFLSGWKAT